MLFNEEQLGEVKVEGKRVGQVVYNGRGNKQSRWCNGNWYGVCVVGN